MDTGFFQSRQFAVAAFVAAMLVVGGATVLALGGGVGGSFLRAEDGCAARAAAGAPPAPEHAAAEGDGGRTRDESFAVNASDLAGLDLCVAIGELRLVPSDDGRLRVDVRIRGDTAEAARETVVEARFARDDKGLRVAVWQSRVGYSSSPFGGQDATETVVTVRVPDGAWPDLAGSVGVGGLRATDVMLGNATLDVDVGDVRLLRVDLAGDLEARVDVGEAIVHLGSVQAGTLTVGTDVGDVELRLPPRADVGYDVTAQSGVGSATVRIGETEDRTESSGTTGESVHARSRGYDAKPTKVRVHASADVGSVLVSV